MNVSKKEKGEAIEKLPKKKPAIFKKKWFKPVVIIVIILAIAGIAFTFLRSRGGAQEEALSTAVVTRGDIEVKVTGSGTVEANETYNIVPTVNGEITFCDVEEGDFVEEGQILYKFDSETSDKAIKTAENRVKTAENSVESARIRLEQAKENIAKLTVTAPAQGVISDLSLVVGDNAGGVLCVITDNTYMTVKIPVSASEVSKIKTGDAATVGLERYMTHVAGTVDRVSTAQVAGSGGAMLTYVDIRVNSPGSIAEWTMATATIHTSSGDVDGSQAAALSYPTAAKANAEQQGIVSELRVNNGDWVNKGDVIAVLTSSSLTDNLRSANMSYDDALTNYQDAVTNLQNTRKQAEDSILTAPISGKVLSKSYKKGDTVYGTNSTTLMVVADTSKMKFTLNVDELDVSKISVGQEVDITADAIEDETFKGEITTVSLLGNTANGVTYYPIVITINEPGDLLPGMNVTAEIIAQSAQNVLVVPVGAVNYYNGKYYATVVGEAQISAPSDDMPRGEMPTGEMPTGGMPDGEQDGDRPNFSGSSGGSGNSSNRGGGNRGGGMGGSPGGGGGMPMGGMQMGGNSRNNSAAGNQSAASGIDENVTMYDDQQRVEVVTGISNDDYIVIESGLTEGQVVVVSGSSSTTNTGFGFGGGMGGGMGGGPGGGGGFR